MIDISREVWISESTICKSYTIVLKLLDTWRAQELDPRAGVKGLNKALAQRSGSRRRTGCSAGHFQRKMKFEEMGSRQC